MATKAQITASHRRAVREAEITLERKIKTTGANSAVTAGARRALAAKKARLAEWLAKK